MWWAKPLRKLFLRGTTEQLINSSGTLLPTEAREQLIVRIKMHERKVCSKGCVPCVNVKPHENK